MWVMFGVAVAVTDKAKVRAARKSKTLEEGEI